MYPNPHASIVNVLCFMDVLVYVCTVVCTTNQYPTSCVSIQVYLLKFFPYFEGVTVYCEEPTKCFKDAENYKICSLENLVVVLKTLNNRFANF